MSAYVIDFSEPLKNGFTIAASGFNGPGGSNANTSLRLYGRGALEWGEAVDEDLVRLAETFASASPPSAAVTGQLWMEVQYYYHNDSLDVTSGWYFYDPDSLLSNKWSLLNGTGIVATTVPVTPTEGQYYYTPGFGDATPPAPGTPVGILRGYYSLGRYEPLAFVTRAYMSGTGAPTASTRPDLRLRTFDKSVGTWQVPSVTHTGPLEPANPTPGTFWYQTSTNRLFVRSDINTWQGILGPSDGWAPVISTGPVNMNTFRIMNLPSPLSDTDAANKSYVDSAVAGAGAGVFVEKAGDTGIGPLSMSSLTTTGAANIGTTLNVSGTSTMAVINATTITGSGTVTGANLTTAGATTTGTLSVTSTASIGGILNMTTHRITNVVDPASPQDAATKAYVDAAVGGGSGTTPVINPSTYKAGDIYILTGRIYIASASGTGAPPGGQWRQVYPAVYS